MSISASLRRRSSRKHRTRPCFASPPSRRGLRRRSRLRTTASSRSSFRRGLTRRTCWGRLLYGLLLARSMFYGRCTLGSLVPDLATHKARYLTTRRSRRFVLRLRRRAMCNGLVAGTTRSSFATSRAADPIRLLNRTPSNSRLTSNVKQLVRVSFPASMHVQNPLDFGLEFSGF